MKSEQKNNDESSSNRVSCQKISIANEPSLRYFPTAFLKYDIPRSSAFGFLDFNSSGTDSDGSTTSGISTLSEILTSERSSSMRTATNPPRKTFTMDPIAMGFPEVASEEDEDEDDGAAKAEPRAVVVVMVFAYGRKGDLLC